jgi:hypothetical protein
MAKIENLFEKWLMAITLPFPKFHENAVNWVK